MKRVTVVAVPHPSNPDLFLYFQRQDNKRWTTVCGHCEDGEDPKDAAYRELQEEAGISKESIDSMEELRNQVSETSAGDAIDVYLFQANIKELPELSSYEDPDKEAVKGSFVFLNPLSSDKPMHVPKTRNILIDQLSEKPELEKSELKEEKSVDHFTEWLKHSNKALRAYPSSPIQQKHQAVANAHLEESKKNPAEHERRLNALTGGKIAKSEHEIKLGMLKKALLAKMSRPVLKFPGLNAPTRLDQNVRLLENEKQKKLFSKLAAQSAYPDKTDPVTQQTKSNKLNRINYADKVARKFNRGTVGTSVPVDAGKTYDATIAGKLRSKTEAVPEKNKVVDEYNAKKIAYNKDINEWRKKGMDIIGNNNVPVEEQGAFLRTQPKLPYPPKKSKVKALETDKLPREQQENRGRATESTIQHEATHSLFNAVEAKHGKDFSKRLTNHLLEAIPQDTLNHLSEFIKGRGYKTKNASFKEELLTHARDILVNPAKRKAFEDKVGPKAKEEIQKLKQSWEEISRRAKVATPNLGAEKLAASEKINLEELNKAPIMYTDVDPKTGEDYEDESAFDDNDAYKPLKSKKLDNGMTYTQYSPTEGSAHYSKDNLFHVLSHPQHGTIAHMQTGPDLEDVKHKNVVQWSEVHPEHRGKGLGKLLYTSALEHGGLKSLTSDSRVSPEANRVWESLSRNPNLKTKLGKYPKTRSELDFKPGLSEKYEMSRHKITKPKNAKPMKLAASELEKKSLDREERSYRATRMDKSEDLDKALDTHSGLKHVADTYAAKKGMSIKHDPEHSRAKDPNSEYNGGKWDMWHHASNYKPEAIKKADDSIKMPKKDFLKEHKKLLDVLKHPSYKKLKDEYEEQSKELEEKNLTKSLIGYRTDHTKWFPLEEHKAAEEDKGNSFPDISKFPKHEAIWVTHNPKVARRYGKDVRQVDLSGAKKIHGDQEGGYLYARPAKSKELGKKA